MNMGMELHIRPPGMQDGDKTGLRPQELLVFGESENSLACSLEHQVIQHTGVRKHQGVEHRRQCENHMEIWQWKGIGNLFFDPLRLLIALADRAMPVSAGMKMCFGMATVVAALDETAHLRGAAGVYRIKDFGFVEGIALRGRPPFNTLEDFLNLRGQGNHLRSCQLDF